MEAFPLTLPRPDDRELDGALVAALVILILWSVYERSALFDIRTVSCLNLAGVGYGLPNAD